MAQYPAPQNEPREPFRMNEEARRIDQQDVRRMDTTSGRPDVRRMDTTTSTIDERQPGTLSAFSVASPAPLGLGIIGIITAILGCYYTGFIIPFQSASMRPVVGIASLILGLILVLAGMWEFRKNYLLTATLFTSYGGFLVVLGAIFLPNGVYGASGGNVHLLLGMVFLCWTIFLGIMCIGAARANAAIAVTLAFLFLSFFFLMLGSLAFNNGVLLRVGGWLAIATALVSWLASLASLLGIEMPHEAFRVPLGHRLAVIE